MGIRGFPAPDPQTKGIDHARCPSPTRETGFDLKTAVGLFGILATLVFFHGLGTGTLPLIDRDEPRFAEASRETIQRGDWVVPHFNDEPRFHKPPLIYWGQMLSYRLLSEDEYSARLPSALAASLLGLVIFAFGSQLYDKRTGFWAAVVFSLSLHNMLLAKAATADMAVVLFVTVAAWAGWALYGAEKSRHRALEKSQVAGFMTREGPRFCILPAADFAAIEHRLDPRWEKARHRGFNIANGKWVELVLVVKQE